jgi:D-amino-acid oxidase
MICGQPRVGKAQPQIAVIGGGVIGLSTGVVLQALGLDTVLLAEDPSWLPLARPNPAFATVHAAASILPHSVYAPQASRWTRVTASILADFERIGIASVRGQRHYEVFEEELDPGLPDYAAAFDDIAKVMSTMKAGRRRTVPRRDALTDVSGWSFTMMFCEAPEYVRFLHQLYEAAGGSISVGAAAIDDLLAQKIRVVVLCAGHRSPMLIEQSAALDSAREDSTSEPLRDPHAMRYLVGHYICARIPGLLQDEDGTTISYNYHPKAERDAAGTADVYCYSRRDCWLLGGSRIGVDSVEAGLSIARRSPDRGDTLLPDQFGGSVAVPAPILHLNRSILYEFTKGRLDLYTCDPARGDLWAGVGLRALRADPSGNTRVSRSRVAGPAPATIIHNYGHGGAGFAFSWGSAIDVARLVLESEPLAAAKVMASSAATQGSAAVGTVASLARTLIGI